MNLESDISAPSHRPRRGVLMARTARKRDLEIDVLTAARERIPILSILFNNFSMAIELPIMPVSTEKYRSTDISGDYTAFAKAMGGYGERIEKVADIKAAIARGIEATKRGQPALLEFLTCKEIEVSRFGGGY